MSIIADIMKAMRDVNERLRRNRYGCFRCVHRMVAVVAAEDKYGESDGCPRDCPIQYQ